MGRLRKIVLYCLLLGFVSGNIGYLYDYLNRKELFKDKVYSHMQTVIRQGIKSYRGFNRDAILHARFFSQVPLVERMLVSKTQPMKDQISVLLKMFAELYGRYMQVRVLDAEGMEVIRFDRSGQEVIEIFDLQNKGSESYFKSAQLLPHNGVFVSAMTPNREFGIKEVPHQATFRSIATVDSAQGQRLGYIVLNARAGEFMTDIAEQLIPGLSGYDLWFSGDLLGVWLFRGGVWYHDPDLSEALDQSKLVEFSVESSGLPDAMLPGNSKAMGRGIEKLDEYTPTLVNAEFSPKLNFRVSVPEDSWIRFEDSHVPVLDSERYLLIMGRSLLLSLVLAWLTILYIKRAEVRQSRRAALTKQIHTDHLTGVLSRAGLDAALATHQKRMGARNVNAVLCLLDIDHFKKINDGFGHATGDLVLIQLSKLLNAELRDTDIFARWGGEEFVIILFGVSTTLAHKVTERYRQVIERFVFLSDENKRLQVTASIGVAKLNLAAFEQSFRAADTALYAAKAGGRNQVRVEAFLPDSATLTIGDTLPNLLLDTDLGPLSVHDYMGGQWLILFSHPKDFTPVCTTELASVARRAEEWQNRRTKVLGLSIDDTASHRQWKKDIATLAEREITYPIISDKDLKISKLLDMLPEDAYLSNDFTADDAQTVRGVFIFSPDAKLQASLLYPMNVGRNFDDITRLLDELQTRWVERVPQPTTIPSR